MLLLLRFFGKSLEFLCFDLELFIESVDLIFSIKIEDFTVGDLFIEFFLHLLVEFDFLIELFELFFVLVLSFLG